MTETKMFETAALASVTTGVLMIDSFSKVHEAAEWVMGHPIGTHQFPALADQLAKAVLKQYPDMPTKVGEDGWEACRDKAVKRYGLKVIVNRGKESLVSPFDHIPEHLRDKTCIVIEKDKTVEEMPKSALRDGYTRLERENCKLRALLYWCAKRLPEYDRLALINMLKGSIVIDLEEKP